MQKEGVLIASKNYELMQDLYRLGDISSNIVKDLC